MAKVRFNQTISWILAVLITTIGFGLGLWGVRSLKINADGDWSHLEPKAAHEIDGSEVADHGGHDAHGEEAATDDHGAKADEHGAKADEHGAKADEHGAKADEHGAKADEHGAKADEHGAKADEHGAKADGHGAKAEKGAHGGAVHWGYEGPAGPIHWGELSPDYEICATGKQQSPIDLPEKSMGATNVEVSMHYGEAQVTMLHNGHTVQVNDMGDNYILIDGDRYNLWQFHFHTPSEHKVRGLLYSMEAHFVHKNSAGKLAVVGVLVRGDGPRAHRKLAQLMKEMPGESGAKTKTAIPFIPEDLMPEQKAFWHYPGSLTTPPCSEGVKWFVLKKSITASDVQIEAFHKAMGTNNRPVQPLYTRKVLGGKI